MLLYCPEQQDKKPQLRENYLATGSVSAVAKSSASRTVGRLHGGRTTSSKTVIRELRPALATRRGAIEHRLAAAVGWPPPYHAHGSAFTPPLQSIPEPCLPESTHQITPPSGRFGRLRRSAGRLQLSTENRETLPRSLAFRGCKALHQYTPHLLLKGGGCTSTRNNGVNSVLVGVGQRITNRFLTLFEESATVWKDH